MKKLVLGGIFLFTAVVGSIVGFGVGAIATAGTSNDRVLGENQYNEYFKKEGSNKNYLYTETEFKDAWGRKCTVVTGASESTIALSCF